MIKIVQNVFLKSLTRDKLPPVHGAELRTLAPGWLIPPTRLLVERGLHKDN